jgi:DNA-binding CsgD family transcriptional regulator
MRELSDRQRDVLQQIAGGGNTKPELADALDIKPTTVEHHLENLREKGYDFDQEIDGNRYEWYISERPSDAAESDGDDTDADAEDAGDEDDFEWVADEDHSDALPDLSETPVDGTADPDPEDLTDRERVLVAELQTGATLPELTERLDERESIVTEHLRDLRRSGWRVYVDETAGHVGIESDAPLRSSEHKGTRTRKANRWWERTHNALVRHYQGSNSPRRTYRRAAPRTGSSI